MTLTDTVPPRRSAIPSGTLRYFLAIVWLFAWTVGVARADGEVGSEISAPDALALVERNDLTIIDVRRPSEWRDTGLPVGAVGISIHNMIYLERSAFIDDVRDAVGGQTNRPIAVICAAGVRSARAQELLREAGFTAVVDINEGMLGNGHAPGWMARALPTVPCPNC